MKINTSTDFTPYALLAGSSAQTFSVAPATAIAHAVRADQIQKQSLVYYTLAGGAGAYTLTTTPPTTGYVEGERWCIKMNTTCSNDATINRDGLGAIYIQKHKPDGTLIGIRSGELVLNQIVDIVYNGTKFVAQDVTYEHVTNGNLHDHSGGDGAAIVEAAITLADNTTNNASTTKHGFLKKLSNVSTEFMGGTGAWTSLTAISGWVEVADTWTRITQSYTNDPAAGQLIDLDMGTTTSFAVKDGITVSSSAGAENAQIHVVTAATSITVGILNLNHTTTNPVVILHKFTVPTGATSIYSAGMKLRWKQGGSYKYAYIKAVTDTTVSLVPQADYAVTDATITDVAYSSASTPLNFPTNFNWTPAWDGITYGNSNSVNFYKIIEGVCYFSMTFTLGSTGSIGTNFYFTLPVVATSSISPTVSLYKPYPPGIVKGTADFYEGVGIYAVGGAAVRVIDVFGGATFLVGNAEVSTNYPFTWAASHSLLVVG